MKILKRYNFKLVAANGMLYALGGEALQKDGLFDIEKFNIANGTWENSGAYLQSGPRFGFCATVSQDQSSIFVVGGIDSNGGRKRFDKLDLYSMKWTLMAEMFSGRSAFSCAPLQNGLLVAGGWSGEEFLKSVEFFDTEKEVWFEEADMQIARANFDLVSYFDGGRQMVSALGGRSATFNFVESIETFKDGVWEYSVPMSKAKSNVASVVVPEGFNIFEGC